jgi:hypothetical protein
MRANYPSSFSDAEIHRDKQNVRTRVNLRLGGFNRIMLRMRCLKNLRSLLKKAEKPHQITLTCENLSVNDML